MSDLHVPVRVSHGSEVVVVRSRALGTAAALAASLFAGAARADPEWNIDVALGVAGRGQGATVWDGTAFHGSVRGDLIWGRHGSGDFGLGPSAEIATLGFRDARLHLGPTALVPLGSSLSLLVTPAGYVRTGPSPIVGASGRILLGFRSFNHYGSYAITNGLSVGVDQDLSGSSERVVIVAADLDGALLALPLVLLVQWIRGSPDGS